tara:strand:- start:1558 stop:1803 length:246 start_codon:yes stop_codon:yes gene_type:complete
LNDPEWYKRLHPETQEVVDQTAHLFLGLGLSAMGGAYLSMVALYIREFWIQWPVERVADTRKDMAFWIGGTGIWEVARAFS